MWVHFGTAEHLVDPIDQLFRHGMLEALGFVMHFGPTHPQHLHQEQFDQPVAPQHERRQLLSCVRQSHAHVRLVVHEP